jgi:hypothetical protein
MHHYIILFIICIKFTIHDYFLFLYIHQLIPKVIEFLTIGLATDNVLLVASAIGAGRLHQRGQCWSAFIDGPHLIGHKAMGRILTAPRDEGVSAARAPEKYRRLDRLGASAVPRLCFH